MTPHPAYRSPCPACHAARTTMCTNKVGDPSHQREQPHQERIAAALMALDAAVWRYAGPTALERIARALDLPGKPTITDRTALDMIADVLTGRAWGPDELDHIASAVRQTGRTVAELDDLDDPDPTTMARKVATIAAMTKEPTP